MSNKPQWSEHWEPGAARRPLLSFGDDPRAVVRLDGGYEPQPIPPDYTPPRPQPRVEIVEPQDGWWRGDGAFGFRYQGAVPPLPRTIIPLTEQLRLPGPPRVWWIHWIRYSRNIETEASPNYGSWDLRGRVTYGVGGAQNIVECDVMAGMQLGVVCNSVKVDLLSYAPEIDGLGVEVYDPGEIGVVAGAMFGDGAGSGALPPTWSTPIYTAAVDGSLAVDIAVPDFARSVVLHSDVAVPADLSGVNLFFNTPGITEKTVNAQTLYADLTREKGIALPAHTNQIRLQSTAAVARSGARFSLQFFLAL